MEGLALAAVGVLAVMLPLIALDAIFLGANALKIMEGGWMPLALGAAIFLLMWTWREGSRLLAEKSRLSEVPLHGPRRHAEAAPAASVPGTAVFLRATRRVRPRRCSTASSTTRCCMSAMSSSG